jgi:hypothetical protein
MTGRRVEGSQRQEPFGLATYLSKDIAQDLRGSVSNLRLLEEVPFGCDVRHQSDDPGHLIERPQAVSCCGEHV